MIKLFGAAVATLLFLFVSCEQSNPIAGYSITDKDNEHADIKDENIAEKDEDQADIKEENEADCRISRTNVDTDVVHGDLPASCMTDMECKDMGCGAPLICVSARCAQGCAADSDCAAYEGTKCNTKLARCLNVSASAQACGEANCETGCCYADKGFVSLSCLKTPDIKVCGICKQGEVYMDGKECVPAARDTASDKCRGYNSTESESPEIN